MSYRKSARGRACPLIVFGLVGAFVWTTPATYAGSSQADRAQPLTLNEALNQATDNNYAVRQARARVDARAGAVQHAERPVPSNPQVSLNTGRRSPDNGDDFQDVGLRLSQEFWTAGKGQLQLEAARARKSAAAAQLDFLVTSVRARTRRAFLNLLAAKEALETAHRVLEAAHELQSFTERRLDAGAATKLEVNTSEIAVGRAEAAVARAESRRRQARIELAERLSRDPANPLRIKGKLKPAPLNLPSETRLLNGAARRRSDLNTAARRLAANREELKLSKARLIPNITVFAGVEQEGSNDVARIGASMPLPVLHRFGGEQKKAEANVREAQLAQEQLQLQVRRQVLDALARYRSARRRVEIFTEKMLTSAEQNLALTREAFKAGKVGAPSITSAQNNLLTVRRNYLDALDDLIRAGTDLERGTGGLLAIQSSATATSGTNQTESQ